MKRRIKTLSLSLVVVAAMCMAGGSAAQANFTASTYPAHGSSAPATHTFTFQNHTVHCTSASFTGTLAAASSQITLLPKYAGCTAFGFVGATIDMNSCDFLFTTNWGGALHIQCSEVGDSITITAGGCVVHILPQTPTVNSVDYDNVHPGILITSTLSGIHANVTSSFPCTLSSKSTDTSGAYHGSIQLNPQAGVTMDAVHL